MSKKFLFVDSNGFYVEATAYESTDFINTSAGAGDAGKPVVLDASGLLASSMINVSSIDHGGFGGLGDDDHTQYILADGSRNFSAKVSYSSHPSFTSDTELVDKKFVEDILLTSEWYPYSALDYVTDNTAAPATENTNDVYVLAADGGTPHANWDGASAGDIVNFDGASWIATTPTTGTRIGVDDEASVAFYLWGGSAWAPKYEESTTASTGLTKVAFDIRVDWSTAFNDAKAIKAQDLASVSNGYGASIIGIEDAGTYLEATDVEAALAELYLLQRGNNFTVGTGGVTKGDLIYISAANTVLPYATITASNNNIGLAGTTEIAAASVNVVANQKVLAGVLTTATAGTRYYWNGTGYTTTIPTNAAAFVWAVGVAKNATDLYVDVQRIKKNEA